MTVGDAEINLKVSCWKLEEGKRRDLQKGLDGNVLVKSVGQGADCVGGRVFLYLDRRTSDVHCLAGLSFFSNRSGICGGSFFARLTRSALTAVGPATGYEYEAEKSRHQHTGPVPAFCNS